MTIHRFSFPTAIQFGPGAKHGVFEYLKSHALKRPLVVTDRGVSKLPILKEFVGDLAGLALDVHDGISGNPVRAQVSAGVEAFWKHRADSIIGFGGGAALDVAKAIALMAHHPGDLFDYEDQKPGALPIDREIPFFVAVPTTSGTGSEVGRSAVISDDATHVKRIVFSPRLLAKAVFADPELTLDLPAPVTAATGMDALTHCVEAYLAKGYHPICDGIALEGVRLAAKSLPRAVREPRALDARGDMMMVSMMGAIAFQKGLGLTHSCAHALGTVKDLHHGLANGIMIDHALRHNLAFAEERFRNLAQAAGLEQADGGAFLAWLDHLKAEIGIPRTLVDLEITPKQLSELIRVAFEDSCHLNSPRPCTSETFQEIFEGALA